MAAGHKMGEWQELEQCPHLSSGRGKTLSLVIQSCPPHGRFFRGIMDNHLAEERKKKMPENETHLFLSHFLLWAGTEKYFSYMCGF